LFVTLTFMRLTSFGWRPGALVNVSFRTDPDVERDPQLFTPTSDRMWLQLPPFSSLSWSEQYPSRINGLFSIAIPR
jgi:hypothetical protein